MITYLKALVHQTHGRFVVMGFLGQLSPGKGTIVGANFLGHSSLGSVGFGFSWKFITRKHGFLEIRHQEEARKNIGFLVCSSPRSQSHGLKQLHHQEEVGLWCLSLGRSASLASNMSPRRKQCHEEEACHQEQHGTRKRRACIIKKKMHLSCMSIIVDYYSCMDMFLKLSLGSSIIVVIYIHMKKSYSFPLPKFSRFSMKWNKID